MRCILIDLSDYVVFRDSDDEESLYAMTINENDQLKSLVKKYNHDYDKIPVEETVEAYRLTKTGERDEFSDNYDIVGETEEFPVNRINWVLIGLR